MTTTETIATRADAPYQLSDGWRLARLGDVAEIGAGITLGRKLRGEATRLVPYLRVANVKDAYLDLSDIYQLEATEAEIRKCRLRYGDLLLTEGGDPDKLGRGTYWQEELPECIHQNHIFRVRFDPTQFDIAFVSSQISSPYGKAYFLSLAKQTTGIATINQQVLAGFPLMVPPLAEQRRIAAILRERLAAVERARAAAEVQRELLGHLTTACLTTSLAESGIEKIVLHDCLVEVSKGVGPSWQQYRVVGATRAGLAPAKESVGKTPERYKLVSPGTIFYNPMRILLGSIALIDVGEEPGITSPDYVVVQSVPGVLHPRWFYHWLRSSYGEDFIKTMARGAVRERLLFRRLASGEIEIPSWDSQLRVADKLLAARIAREKIAEQIEQINALPAALLRQAFRGEL